MTQVGRGIAQTIVRGAEDTRLRATWRILLAFALFFAIYGIGSTLLGAEELPDVLLNGPTGIVIALAVVIVAIVVGRFVDKRPRSEYGFEFGGQWWLDFVAAIGIGFLFQALVTGLFLWIGVGRIVGEFSPGVAHGTLSLAIALTATIVGFLSVALWEEFLFRGVIIRNAVEGLRARGISQRSAVGGAWLASVVVFGLPHMVAVASGATPMFAVVQALLAGVYFGLAYVLTDSLAFPIGLHFATNFWVASIVGQPNSSFPAMLRMERALQLNGEVVAVMGASMTVLIGLIIAWVYVSRGRVTVRTVVSQTDALTTGATTGN